MLPTVGMETCVSPVNWKSVRDVDNEGYHVAMAHPALQDLYGAAYYDEPLVDGVNRSHGAFNAGAGRRWSVNLYRRIAPEATHLPEHQRKAWVYYGLFPNTVFVFMPETVQFYQEFPASVNQTVAALGELPAPATRPVSNACAATCTRGSSATPTRKTCS